MSPAGGRLVPNPSHNWGAGEQRGFMACASQKTAPHEVGDQEAGPALVPTGPHGHGDRILDSTSGIAALVPSSPGKHGDGDHRDLPADPAPLKDRSPAA